MSTFNNILNVLMQNKFVKLYFIHSYTYINYSTTNLDHATYQLYLHVINLRHSCGIDDISYYMHIYKRDVFNGHNFRVFYVSI